MLSIPRISIRKWYSPPSKKIGPRTFIVPPGSATQALRNCSWVPSIVTGPSCGCIFRVRRPLSVWKTSASSLSASRPTPFSIVIAKVEYLIVAFVASSKSRNWTYASCLVSEVRTGGFTFTDSRTSLPSRFALNCSMNRPSAWASCFIGTKPGTSIAMTSAIDNERAVFLADAFTYVNWSVSYLFLVKERRRLVSSEQWLNIVKWQPLD